MPTTTAVDPVVHLSAEKRAAKGEVARAKLPLEVHGTWARAADRPDPLALLED